MNNKIESVKDVLLRLSNTNTSTENDEAIIRHIFEKLDLGHKVVVTCGCVYIDPPSAPMSIHSAAEQVINAFKAQGIPF